MRIDLRGARGTRRREPLELVVDVGLELELGARCELCAWRGPVLCRWCRARLLELGQGDPRQRSFPWCAP